MVRGVLFDVDGTLIDSVDLHAEAWQKALARFGKDVPRDELRAQIGKGGAEILRDLLSDEEFERYGEDLDEYRAGLYQREFLPWAKPFPHARELLARLKQIGALVGLASSCRRVELGYYLRMVGGASLVDAATTADDVENGKPSPDVFEACLERMALSPGQAVAVGDSPYDVEAAGGAGLSAVGVLSGGFSQRALEAAGCLAVYQDVGDLLTRLDDSPLGRGGAQR